MEIIALPFVPMIEDCVEFSLTVPSHLSQLQSFPHDLLFALSTGSPRSLVDFYTATNPLVSSIAFSVLVAATVLLVSEWTRNFSQIDRLWGILPGVYVAHMAVWSRCVGLASSRVDLAAVATILWGVRLTYNYWRKGGYQAGSEDYRWERVRKDMSPSLFFLCNIFFISFFQSLLLALLSAVPAYIMVLSNTFKPGLTTLDIVYFSIEVLLVVGEWISDEQQWAYQSAKKNYQKLARLPPNSVFTQEQLDCGFVTSGLWAYSRHPNFACEQSIWLVLYIWGVTACNAYLSWSIAGSALLVILFQASTDLTESISLEKYPDYLDYQRHVARFVPFPWASPYTLRQTPKNAPSKPPQRPKGERRSARTKKEN